MKRVNGLSDYHNDAATGLGCGAPANVWNGFFLVPIYEFSYDFKNFFHPFVGDLITKLNQTSIAGMLDPSFLAGLKNPTPPPGYKPNPSNSPLVTVNLEPQQIDVATSEPYANYNWELLYHIPAMVAVHLSNNQRFAEAQNWFHLVFDPTSKETDVPPPARFWKSFVFRSQAEPVNLTDINTLLELLSTPDSQITDPTQQQLKASVIAGYDAILADPFQPHVVARTRPVAYQWYVVMKYLDNLIAWGDSLFLADTIETINEATLCYVLAANILGPRPQVMPQPGKASPRNFRQLKQAGLDRMGNALVDLEAQFPFNLLPEPSKGGTTASDQSGALFGIGRSLYFCIPQNQNLLAYWDTVADRLFKIRNSENIQGVVQQLPLFDPPLDPGMLVKAAAAGIDIGSIVSGLNQPLGPYRTPLLIQKAIELAGEVRSLGNTLLASFEKGDAEALSLLRQGNEVALQRLVQNVRYLQWQHAQETTNGLLKTRDSALERYTYYMRLLNQPIDSTAVPPTFTLDRRELTEANFDDTFSALVTTYDLTIKPESYNPLQLAQGSSPSAQAGASGTGSLYLNKSEDAELNTHLPTARDGRLTANVANAVATCLTPIPTVEVHLAFWGLGIHSNLLSGTTLAAVAKLAADVAQTAATYETDQATIANRTSTYQRRTDEWTLQANLAARDLMSIGRQILASLIAEQVANHDYQTVKTQVQQAQGVQAFLQTKFTSAVFYGWMQSQISSLYYQYYRFACDTARKAEQTMQRELVTELQATSFIAFNYWDTGHQGLLSGEALYLDVKRMEMAYYDNNKRELELTRHVSLRQLDPLALLNLKVTGACTVTIPEWLYDRDCPGHYMRRIKSVALSIPSVVGPYTSVNCTATLLQSTVRVSSLLNNGTYARSTTSDDRFVDYFSSVQSIVTSGGNADSGMFETNLRDERFLPFEGAGAVSTWSLSLPSQLRAFDYMTISDVILHVRYTARDGGAQLGSQAIAELKTAFEAAGQSGLVLLFSLRYDFPTAWSAFANGSGGYTFTLQKDCFPYMVQSFKTITVDGLVLYAQTGSTMTQATQAATDIDLTQVSTNLNSPVAAAAIIFPADQNNAAVFANRSSSAQIFLIVSYHLSF